MILSSKLQQSSFIIILLASWILGIGSIVGNHSNSTSQYVIGVSLTIFAFIIKHKFMLIGESRELISGLFWIVNGVLAFASIGAGIFHILRDNVSLETMCFIVGGSIIGYLTYKAYERC